MSWICSARVFGQFDVLWAKLTQSVYREFRVPIFVSIRDKLLRKYYSNTQYNIHKFISSDVYVARYVVLLRSDRRVNWVRLRGDYHHPRHAAGDRVLRAAQVHVGEGISRARLT